jgi:hypothetical protein
VSETPFYPFVPRRKRQLVTHEPDTHGQWSPLFPDMIGYRQEGGGAVPSEYTWPSNPKQVQEELTDSGLRKEAKEFGALAESEEQPALPPGPRL